MHDDMSDEQIQDMALQVLRNLKHERFREVRRVASATVGQERHFRSFFERRLLRRWGKAFDLYDLFVITARQAGEASSREFLSEAAENHDYVYHALVRIHARSCLIASEIRALLVSGHASGALARWRTLHELTVVAQFLKVHGQDVAERYMWHESMQTAKAARRYEQYQEDLGNEPLDAEELAQIYGTESELKARYGKAFAEPWGWAADALHKPRPTFFDVEEAAGLGHIRVHTDMAHTSVHAGYKGMTSDIGLLGRANYETIMLSGPTNAGLALPGANAVQSLLMCSISLLTCRNAPVLLVELPILKTLGEKAREAFFTAHDKLVEDESKFSQATEVIL